MQPSARCSRTVTERAAEVYSLYSLTTDHVGWKRGVREGHANAGFTRLRPLRVRCKRNRVKGREAHAYLQARRSGMDGRDDFAQKARAVLEAAAIVAGACVCTQELMSEIAMAVFDVHEIE